MKFVTKVKKYKNKYFAIIPKAIEKEYNLKAGDMVDVKFKAVKSFDSNYKVSLRASIKKID